MEQVQSPTCRSWEPKYKAAHGVMIDCIGRHGLWASPHRYRDQCWTRDFAYAGFDYLTSVGEYDLIKGHLTALVDKQAGDGRTPILFLDDKWRFLARKAWSSLKHRRLSFMLRRHFEEGVEWLTPWTKDSEMLFALAAGKLYRSRQDKNAVWPFGAYVGQALDYVEKKLLNKDGLMLGADWRDTRLDLGKVCLLSNNCLLAEAYELNGFEQESQELRARITRHFWNGEYYRDYVGGQARTDRDAFDMFGNALAILGGLGGESLVFRAAAQLATPYGYRLNGVTLPTKDAAEAAVMSRTDQHGVIWPFTNGYLILAMLKSGLKNVAKAEFEKWSGLDGFYEWYDPQTGRGMGSPDQMWTAAMYVRVADALAKENLI